MKYASKVSLHKICENTGEYGSVKTRILAYFVQCRSEKPSGCTLLGFRNYLKDIKQRLDVALLYYEWTSEVVTILLSNQQIFSETSDE